MNRNAILGLLLVAAGAGYFYRNYHPRRPAPAFDMKTVDGRSVTLEDNYGQVLILDFWASWCPPCRESIPAINRVYGQFRDRGVMVYGVQVRDDVDPGQYLKARGADYPALIGNDDVQKAYGVVSIPTVVVIGVDGSVVYRSSGWSSSEEARLGRALNTYLAQVGMN